MSCSSDKARSKKSPSWWLRVSDDHYMVNKVSMEVDGLDSSSHFDLSLAEDSVTIYDDLKVIPTMVLNQNVVSNSSLVVSDLL